MTESYFPFPSGTGTQVDEANWSMMARNWARTGVVADALNGLAVSASGSGMDVSVDTGRAFIMGVMYDNGAPQTISIAAADTTNPRIDVIALRLDWTNNTVGIAYLQGVAASSPVAPSLTQIDILTSPSTAKWEIPLAQVYVAANASSIASSNVTDERPFTTNAKGYSVLTDFGASVDASDNSQALIDAINAAGKGGTLYVPQGSYKILQSGIQTPDYFAIVADGIDLGIEEPASRAELDFSGITGTVNCLDVGGSFFIRGVGLNGPGKSSAVTAISSSADNIRGYHAEFRNFGVGITFGGSPFYSQFHGCDFVYCGKAVSGGVNIYNLHFFGTTFRQCGISVYSSAFVRPLSIFGGSIEGYGTSGAVETASGSTININGTYFETQTSGAVGVTVSGNDSILNLHNNVVYLNYTSRWVNLSGVAPSHLNASGNKFIYSSQWSGGTPVAYYLPPSGEDVHISGDDWTNVAYTADYTQGPSISGSNFNITPPKGVNTAQYIGRPLVLVAQSTAPASPIANAPYLADGANWNPLGLTNAKSYLVSYDGTNWVGIGGVAGTKFKSSRTTNQSIAATTWTKVNFNSTDFDALGEYDSGTNPRYNAQTSEIKEFGVGLDITGLPSNGFIEYALYVNGSAHTTLGLQYTPTGGALIVTGSTLISISAGDYVEAWVYASAACTVVAGTPTYFWGRS